MTGKIKKILGIALFSALFLYAAYFQLYTHDYTGYRERWLQCLDYLEEGTFWSGQPYCDGGPLVYYSAYLMGLRSGTEHFQTAMLVFNSLLSIALLMLIWKVWKKETGTKNKLFIAVLYGFLVYVNSVTEFETIFMSFFIFLTYYLLFYTDYNQKEWYAGIVIAIAIFSKFNAIVFFGFIGLCYLFTEKIIQREGKQIVFTKEWKKYTNGIKVMIPAIAGVIFFRMKYDFFFIYFYLNATKQSIALSYGEALRRLLLPSFNTSIINIIPLYFLVFICWYAFYREIKEGDLKTYTFIAALGLPTLIFLMVKAFGIGFATDFRYWTPVMPFVILSMTRIFDTVKWDKTKRLQKAILTASIATILIFPGAYYSPLTHLYSPANFIVKFHHFTKEKFDFMSKLNYGYSIVQEQKGKVLVEWGQPHYIDELYQEFNISIPREQLGSITGSIAPTHPDVWQFPRFQELLGENLVYDQKAQEGLTEKEKALVKEIKNGMYSLIIFGPPNWFVTNRILNTLKESNEYCGVEVPSNVWLDTEGLQTATFFFREPKDCDLMIKKLYEYYEQNFGFEEICKIDKYSTEVVKMAMEKNGALIEKTCVGGGEEILPFLKENTIIKKWQLLCMLLLMFLCLVYYLPAMLRDDIIGVEKEKEEKKEYMILRSIKEEWEQKAKEYLQLVKEQKRNKIIYYIILLVLIFLLFYLYKRLDYNIPYNAIYVK